MQLYAIALKGLQRIAAERYVQCVGIKVLEKDFREIKEKN